MRGDPDLIYSMLTKAVTYDSENGIQQVDRFTQNRLNNQRPNLPPAQILNQPYGQTTPVTFPRASTTAVGTDAGNDITLPGESAGQIGGGGGGQGGGVGGGGQFGGGGQAGGGGVGTLVGGTALVPQGIQQVIYDPTDNSFIVRGSEEAIRELERLIEQFDQQPKQVVIKVEFVASSQSSDRALGIDWLYGRGTINAGVRPGEFAASGNPVFFNYSTGNISSRLRTLMNNGWGRTVSAPLLRTLNNQPAIVAQSVTTFIFVPIINNGPGGQQTVFQPVAVPVQTFLTVRPRINNNGTITMTLTPQIANITGFSVSPDGSQLPNITQQTLTLSTIVKDGETIALAGFTTKADNFTVKRIPVLSELPIIGQLFRTHNDSRQSSELVVFVTPHIVEDGDLGLQP
jgi:type II secretory pathway component GspD/PulD (secretin)